MQISKGVEWACHAAALMAALPEDKALRADALARYHEVPAAYMAKQLQALSKAGLVKSSRGARGGYRLAKPPMEINLWEITAAIEGNKSAFRCTEIRQNGPCPARKESCNTPCAIAASFLSAETAFRDSLRDVSLAQIAMGVMSIKTPDEMMAIMQWISDEAV
jgi:Rrf2 family protein